MVSNILNLLAPSLTHIFQVGWFSHQRYTCSFASCWFCGTPEFLKTCGIRIGKFDHETCLLLASCESSSSDHSPQNPKKNLPGSENKAKTQGWFMNKKRVEQLIGDVSSPKKGDPFIVGFHAWGTPKKPY